MLLWSFSLQERLYCVSKGDEAAAVGDHDLAIELYSASIKLDTSCATLYAQRSRAKLRKNLFTEVIQGVEMVQIISFLN